MCSVVINLRKMDPNKKIPGMFALVNVYTQYISSDKKGFQTVKFLYFTLFHQFFGRMAQNSAETVRLLKISSSGNWVEKIMFYTVFHVSFQWCISNPTKQQWWHFFVKKDNASFVEYFRKKALLDVWQSQRPSKIKVQYLWSIFLISGVGKGDVQTATKT